MVEDEGALRLFQTLAAELGVSRRSGISNEEIVERLLHPMVNESMRTLDEGITQRSSDLDIVWIAGDGLPDHHGGSMFMADGISLRHIAERLQAYGSMKGDRHDYWTVSPLLTGNVKEGQRVTAWHAGATHEEVIA